MYDKIESAAIKLAKKRGLRNITRAQVCAAAKVKDGSFCYYAKMSFADLITLLEERGIGKRGVKVTRNKVHRSLRREQILEAAVEISKVDGYDRLTMRKVAGKAKVCVGTLNNHFTLEELRDAVLLYAIDNEVFEILSQAICVYGAQSLELPKSIKNKLMLHLAKVAS